MSDEDDFEREVRRATGAARRPWWFTVLGLAFVVGAAGAAHGVSNVAAVPPEMSPLFGLAAGMLLTVTVLGHTPARYRNARTGEYETFWSRRSRRARGWCAFVAALMIAIGVVIDWTRRG